MAKVTSKGKMGMMKEMKTVTRKSKPLPQRVLVKQTPKKKIKVKTKQANTGRMISELLHTPMPKKK